MKGYPIPIGYMGKMPNGKWRLFSTEEEYKEIYNEES